MIKHLRVTVSALLALAAFASPLSAWALGLGQMEVKSRRDEPLIAEIPIISNDPAELEALQARLASPDTFRRIGLAQPTGIVSDLQFTVAVDARGRPVVRVTSANPVQQPLLTFLVEVDWGQGRLVREYSALIDAPQTAAAPVQPPIDEVALGDPNTVVRPAEPTIVGPSANPLDAPAPQAVPLAPQPTAVATATNPSPSNNPLDAPAPIPVPIPVPPPPSDVPATEPAPVVASIPAPPVTGVSLSAEDTHRVERGETLGGIAAGLGGEYTLDQTIVALLRANPEAFIGGNANRLKAGAVLRIPDGGTIASYSPDEAALVMREQMSQWRGARRALPQPPAVVGSAAATATAAPRASAAAASRAAEARLEIVPASASAAARAATRSGISAGGKGDMLREQELLETKETLAARSAEVDELKARVAELEQLQAKQQQLIALKDTELATAQQRLASASAAPATAASAASKPEPGMSYGPWLGVGAGLLLIGLLAGWWLRRKPSAASAFAAATADSRAAASGSAGDRIDDRIDNRTDVGADPFADEPDTTRADAAFGEAAPAMQAPQPAWSRGGKPVDDAPAAAPSAPSTAVPRWHDPLTVALDEAAIAAEVAPLNPAPPGLARIDLAKAYLDMGDRDTARSLLREVAALGDRASRDEAVRLLRDLG
ncbi:MAG: ferrous iron transporter B [Lysobacter sp.]|nr:MAG: ferrous iron transporter B [Lysobacter sp.]